VNKKKKKKCTSKYILLNQADTCTCSDGIFSSGLFNRSESWCAECFVRRYSKAIDFPQGSRWTRKHKGREKRYYVVIITLMLVVECSGSSRLNTVRGALVTRHGGGDGGIAVGVYLSVQFLQQNTCSPPVHITRARTVGSGSIGSSDNRVLRRVVIKT
jgi:hypothetical protein